MENTTAKKTSLFVLKVPPTIESAYKRLPLAERRAVLAQIRTLLTNATLHSTASTTAPTQK